MNYIPLEEHKHAWVFRHKDLPISPDDLALIKPMTEARAANVWTTFISQEQDHPDFFTEKEWLGQKSTWLETINWEKAWEKEGSALPDEVLSHLAWDNNTTVYFCLSRNNVIETRWDVFVRCWQNFLFMSDGVILLGKKRQQVAQFMANGTVKLGQKSA